MQHIVSALEEDLKDKSLPNSRKEETITALNFAIELLAQALEYQKHQGKKTLSTILCIGREYCGAVIGALAWIKLDTAVGSIGWPVGAVAGTFIGSLVGASMGSIIAGSIIKKI